MGKIQDYLWREFKNTNSKLDEKAASAGELSEDAGWDETVNHFFKKHAKAVFWIVFVWIVLTIVSFTWDAIEDRMKARQYKEDVYYAQSIIYSEVGMGQAVEEFLTKPKWRKAEKMSNGEISVGISGGCNYDGQDCNAWFNFALNPQTKDVELFVITITYPDGRQYTMNNDELASAFYTIVEAAYEKRGLQIPDYSFEYDPYDYIGGGLDKFYDEYFGEFEDALYDAYRSN